MQSSSLGIFLMIFAKGLITAGTHDHAQGIFTPVLSCSICDSRDEYIPHDCQYHPPDPVSCPGNGLDQYCVVIKELDANGTMLSLIRDCSPVMKGNACETIPPRTPKADDTNSAINSNVHIHTGHHNENNNFLCYYTCTEDGCNQATKLSSTMWVVPIGFFTIVFSKATV